MNLNTLKKCIEESKVDDAAIVLKNLYIQKPEKFRKSILLGNILPYPFNSDFEKTLQILKNFQNSYKFAVEKLTFKSTEDSETFLRECDELYTIVNILCTNYRSNCDLFRNNDFLKFSFSSKIHLLCIFIQDYSNQSLNRLMNNIHKEKRFNVSTSLVGNISQSDNSKISYEDQSEFITEVVGEIITYIFYSDTEPQDRSNCMPYCGSAPMKNREFLEIIFLGQHRMNLLNIWNKVKYREWTYEERNDNNRIYYDFIPRDMDSYKKYRASVIRSEHRNSVNYIKAKRDQFSDISKVEKLIRDLSRKVDAFNISTLFSLDNNTIKEISNCYSGLIDAELIRIRKVFGDEFLDLRIGNVKDIKISEYLEMYNFLNVLSNIFSVVLQEFSYSAINDYRVLVPILSKTCVSLKFAHIFSYPLEKAQKILDLFIFKPKSKLDLFSQPLVECNNEDIFFTPTLISSMNVARAIECQLSFYRTKIAEKGIVFEKKIREFISNSPFIKVNRNDIKFEAYDGKTVQYDFLGYFDNHILLIEDKCILEPFSEKEIYETLKKEIKGDAFEQLNRREKILINDWENVRAHCDINLPIQPPSNSDIIKIACVNMFNYSGQVFDDIIITDSNTIINYFTNPIIEQSVSNKGKINKLTKYSIWKQGYPSINEFIEYLKMPIAVSLFYSKLKASFYDTPLIKDSDYRIRCMDFYMDTNLEISDGKKNNVSKIKKIGRNDKCPCGRINPQTGKVMKYKNCCGKSS